MKINKALLCVSIVSITLFGCADENLKPILTFDDAGKGAYVKLIDETTRLVNLISDATIAASTYTYSVEFIDVQNGGLVETYSLNLVYEPVSGADIEIVGFKVWTQADFTDSEDGNRSLTNITITATEMIAAIGKTNGDLTPGDIFQIEGYLTLTSGAEFGASNSSSAVNGNAFQGHFDYAIPASCPSDLAATFNYETSETWCNSAAGITGTVDFIAAGGGQYRFDDWSFGAYLQCWGGGKAGNASLHVTDVCGELSFTGFVDVYGDVWTFVSSIVGNDWNIDWVNTYGETGIAVIHYTGGADWPVTLN